MNIQREILRTIEVIVQKEIENLNIPRDVPTIIKERDLKGNYLVTIDGSDYWVKDQVGLGELAPMDKVWVHIPTSNNFSSAFIIAKR